jgi:hypothetical protein
MTARWICLALMVVGLFTACGEDSAVESEAGGSAADLEEAASRASNLAAMQEARDEALALLKRSSDFLAKQKQFRSRAVIGFEVLQPTGQMLEFGGERTVTLRRPDRLRFEGRNRDGEDRIVLFDGTSIAMVFPSEKAYAAVERPGDLDQALDYMIDELNAPLAMADLFYTDLYTNVGHKIEFGLVVGDSLIGERLCDHLAFSSEDLGVQMWIEKGERPLPARIVFTYKLEEGKPRFWAQLLEWELDPETPDSLFAVVPPEGAERLPVRVVDAAQQGTH